MSGLLIAGAGGHGKVVADIAEAVGRWNQIAFLDDRHELIRHVKKYPVLGNMQMAAELFPEYSDVVVAVGASNLRLDLLARFSGLGFGLPALVHPSAWMSPSARVGEGCVICAQAAIGVDAMLGQGVIVNTGACVDHDNLIGEGVHICPGANLSGGGQVGRGSWLGVGCSVIQGISIGDDVIVGAGAVVIDDVVVNMTVAGVPARNIASREHVK